MAGETCCRNPIHCVVPPYVLDEIAKNGNPKQRVAALRTKAADASFRALRIAAQSVPFSAKHHPLGGAPFADPKPKRTIYDAKNQQNLPGKLMRVEGSQPSGDPAIDEAYDGLGATFSFFKDILNRNSIDDDGLALDATVHFGEEYNNAFWNSVQMVFGDGDNVLFNRFTIALDVIGHELSHGVTEDESQLQYFNQSGALNESMSDVFGSLIKQYAKKQSAKEADWLIGQGLLAQGVQGTALRSMKDPGSAFDDPVLGKDPQPKHMKDFVNTFSDNGGVHINSGIPNHAFYKIAMQIGGFAWEKAGRIWYAALRDSNVHPDTGFQRFAGITYDVAGQLFGLSGPERTAVRDGWAAVGINV
jgi:Zn-dependent metalloprotease